MLSGIYRVRLCILAVTCAIALTKEVRALEPHTPLAQYARQSWSVENGLPQNTVPTLWQTGDGHLLAGTETGLAQLDGVGIRLIDHASTSAFPDAEIRCLWSGNQNQPGFVSDFWVGTAEGLIWMHHGSARRFTTADGLPANSIRALRPDADGHFWVSTDGGLAHWDGKGFQIISLLSGLRGASILSIASGRGNELWVATSGGLEIVHGTEVVSSLSNRLRSLFGKPNLVVDGGGNSLLLAASRGIVLVRQNEKKDLQPSSLVTVIPREALPAEPVVSLTPVGQGYVAAATRSTVILAQISGISSREIGRFSINKQLHGSRIQAVYADREGTLWVGTNRGLSRISIRTSSPRLDRFPATDALADAAILSVLEDREGDLWVGTETAGLHILRDARFHTLSSAEGLSSDNTTAVAEDTYRALWIGTREQGLNRVSATQTTALTTANGLLSNVILSLAPAPDGSLWVGTPKGLSHVGPAIITSYTSRDGLPDNFIRSLLVDADGTVWIGTRHGLTRLANGNFQSWHPSTGLGSDLVGSMTRTSDGDLWVATAQGLTRMHRGQLHTYTTADGLSSNVITALAADKANRLWIGTQSDGVNLWDGQRFHASPGGPGSTYAFPSVIHTLLPDREGYLWIASDIGLTRAEMSRLTECLQHAACAFDSQSISSYSTADGLRSRETSNNGYPTAWRSSSGVLWFTTPHGVISADPSHFPAFPGPPPVSIERFAIDDQEENLFANTRVAAGHLRFQFDYAGISFSAPLKLHYQYMLEGFDHSWTNAGMRRTAYYTNIPPGTYRFRVRAAMDDMDFSTAGDSKRNLVSNAEFSFTLQPHYYQTAWFGVLAVASVVAMILVFVRSRVSRVEREFAAVMAERNRIAREIHDTLAQGYVGISLQLEILGELLRHNKSEAAIKHLASTQELVRDGLNDARQSIWSLRSQDVSESTFPVRVQRLTEQAKDTTLDATFTLHGIYRPLGTATEQELLRIVQEAISNVKHHAAASHLRVQLDYDRDRIVLTISDDGKGFLLEKPHSSGGPIRAAGVDAGHFGILGMQERAALLHCEISIESQPGEGTTIRLQLKTEVASADKNSSASSTAVS